MAQFLRGKQAGVQRDLSAGLNAEIFLLDKVARYGINSQISALDYDPVQSLLAVGTNESRFGPGKIYVFGQKRVAVSLAPQRASSIKNLKFCGNRLVSMDSKNELTIFSLQTNKIESTYSPPGRITAFVLDPTLDYAIVGLQNGEILAYDMDRKGPAPFRLPYLWRDFNQRSRPAPVVTLAFHPRDIGTMLVGYPEGAVIYSFKQNKAITSFLYELPPGALGGYPDPSQANGVRYPKLVTAVWHPTGTFILTGHEDESLVFWDPKTGKVIHARTIQSTNVNQRGGGSGSSGSSFIIKAPLFRVAWCAKQNPDDTGILIAGGMPTNVPERGLTFFDLGATPNYQTSSWDILSGHLERPKNKVVLPTPPNTDVVDFCLIPRASPHFAGSYDPIAVIAILGSGEVVTLSFPSGHPISPTNQLHPSLSFVHPFINKVSLASVDRTKWLGLAEKRSAGPPLLRGGAQAKHQLKRFEDRNIIQTAHADGTIRIWDAGDGDEIENEDMIQVDVARALSRQEAVDVATMSMAGAAGELSVGMGTGEVIIFRWDKNKNFGQDARPGGKTEAFGLESIQDHTDPDLKVGFVPLSMFTKRQAPVTALKNSDIGFVAAGFEDGSIIVIDLRGPALIFESSVSDLTKPSKRSSIRKPSGNQHQLKQEWPTSIEFGVMTLEGEEYSSILLFVGTNTGRFTTYKILPNPHGGHSVQPAGSISVDDHIVLISPLHADSGQPAYASQKAYAALREGYRVNGVVLVVTVTGAKLFKPAAAKGASKSWNEYFCDSAAVARSVDGAVALIGLFGDGSARTFSIPGIKEVSCVRVDSLDIRRFPEAIITSSGSIFGWTGPSELAVVSPWGSGRDIIESGDTLINPALPIPPRPTISNMQWISGTQHITPSDLDLLIGGPDRPPSQRMMDQMRSEELQRREASRSGASSSTAANQQDEGYLAYMQRQMQERTEKMNIMGDSMDNLQQSSSKWADDVSKYVNQQKKKAVMGMIGSKFGF